MAPSQTTLWTLPPTPLPESNVLNAVFITIWLFALIATTLSFQRLKLKSKGSLEFRRVISTVQLSTGSLCIYYTWTCIDRWLRYDQRLVRYSYIIMDPLAEAFRIYSVVSLLWGLHLLLWPDVEIRLAQSAVTKLWPASKLLILVVQLNALFYVILSIALAVVWLQFQSLDAIMNLATKRNQFENAMNVFVALQSLVLFVMAVLHFLRYTQTFSSWIKLAGASLHFARSMMQLGITESVTFFHISRNDPLLLLGTDLFFGLLTILCLGLIWILASQKSHVAGIEWEIHGYVLKKLQTLTENGQKPSPNLDVVLDELVRTLEITPDTAIPSLKHRYLIDTKARRISAAKLYIDFLRQSLDMLEPKPGNQGKVKDTKRSERRALAVSVAFLDIADT